MIIPDPEDGNSNLISKFYFVLFMKRKLLFLYVNFENKLIYTFREALSGDLLHHLLGFNVIGWYQWTDLRNGTLVEVLLDLDEVLLRIQLACLGLHFR